MKTMWRPQSCCWLEFSRAEACAAVVNCGLLFLFFGAQTRKRCRRVAWGQASWSWPFFLADRLRLHGFGVVACVCKHGRIFDAALAWVAAAPIQRWVMRIEVFGSEHGQEQFMVSWLVKRTSVPSCTRSQASTPCRLIFHAVWFQTLERNSIWNGFDVIFIQRFPP